MLSVWVCRTETWRRGYDQHVQETLIILKLEIIAVVLLRCYDDTTYKATSIALHLHLHLHHLTLTELYQKIAFGHYIFSPTLTETFTGNIFNASSLQVQKYGISVSVKVSVKVCMCVLAVFSSVSGSGGSGVKINLIVCHSVKKMKSISVSWFRWVRWGEELSLVWPLVFHSKLIYKVSHLAIILFVISL